MVLNTLLFFLLALGGMIALLPPSYVQIPRTYDKFLHICYCFIFIIFLNRCLADNLPQKEFIVCGLVFGIGFLAELIQGMLPYRHFSKGDIFANSVGVFLGYLVISFSSVI